MANLPVQHNLQKVWSEDGIKVDPSNNKYSGGYEVEIPLYENFNAILYGIDNNIKYSATHPEFEWQADIGYNTGAKATKGGRTWESVKGITLSFGVGGVLIYDNLNEDPEVDYAGLSQIWTQGTSFGKMTQYIAPIPTVTPGGFEDVLLHSKLGVVVGDIFPQATANLWEANQQTLSNEMAVVGLYNTNPLYKNWLVGNVKGRLTVADLGLLDVTPDSRDLSQDEAGVYDLLHTGSDKIQVLPVLDSVVQRTDQGDVAVNALNVAAASAVVAPDHVLAAVGIGGQGGAGTRYLPYPISSLLGATTASSSVPIGTVVAFAGFAIPSGWLSCNGSAKVITQFPELYAAILGTYGGGGGSFNVPDLRGEFIRGMDLGRGVDPGRPLGSNQTDAYRNHDHNYTTVAILVAGVAGATNFYVTHPNTVSGTNQYHHNTDMSGGDGIGTYGDHDFGQPIEETRPRNVAMKYIIKCDENPIITI